LTTITNIKDISKDSVVIVGSSTCVACSQLVKAIDNDPRKMNAYYVSIENVYDYLNSLPRKSRSLPTILIFKEGKNVDMLTGNVSLKTIWKHWEADSINV
jgi:hypothetical protein